MDALHTSFAVEIDAPDGPAALDLERRLAHLTPTAVGCGERWFIEIPTVGCPAEVEAVVSQWLDDIAEPATAMRIDGRTFHVAGRRMRSTRHRGSNADFIG